MNKIQTATSFVLDMCEPKKMSPKQALEFLEGVVSDLEGSIDALKEEMEE